MDTGRSPGRVFRRLEFLCPRVCDLQVVALSISTSNTAGSRHGATRSQFSALSEPMAFASRTRISLEQPKTISVSSRIVGAAACYETQAIVAEVRDFQARDSYTTRRC